GQRLSSALGGNATGLDNTEPMTMTPRTDSASRLIPASPKAVYRAFAEQGAMERWLPPGDMMGTMLHFDFREGGSYRMRLTYAVSVTAQAHSQSDSFARA